MTWNFPFFKQRDAMDCGPTCLMMIAAYHGKRYPLPYLRDFCHISKEGVSALGITIGAERIGYRTMVVKVSYDAPDEQASLMEAPLPCVLHWNQSHFVVLYKLTKREAWIADPAAGKIKLSRRAFEAAWCSDGDEGVAILLEPTPAFYEKDNAVPSDTTQFSYLFQYLNPYHRLITQLILGMLLGSVFQLIFPFLTQSLVDVGIQNQNINFIYIILFAQLTLFLSQMLVQFLQSRITLYIGTRVNVSLVSDFLAKLMRLPIGYFDTKMTGDLMQRIGDQSRIETFLTSSTLMFLFSVVNFFVFSIVLFTYNVSIFSVFLLAAAAYVLWVVLFLKKRKEIDYMRFKHVSDNSNNLIELIQGMQEIKLQGSEQKRRDIWANTQAKLFKVSLKSLSLGQWQDAGAGFINQSKDIFISFFAAKSVIEGDMSLGMMLATQYIVGQLNAPLQQLVAFMRTAQDAKISMERLGEVQQQADEDAMLKMDTNSANYVSILQENITKNGDIHLRNVSFRYNMLADDVLIDIDLLIPNGKVTAIVGTSGSGKTTLIKLLLGFYQATKGTILLGHQNINQIIPAFWRKQCGVVMQDGFVFSDTIANNIAESDERVDVERLLEAAEVANIKSFIESMPLHYNTMIGAKGNGLSQGQKQRLLIARAAYKNPNFLFLDEATNALDANNERVIVENLQRFYANKTVVVVAHRLSTVKHADQIVVLEKGRVVEVGNHIELVKSKGAYFNLVKNQLELGS